MPLPSYPGPGSVVAVSLDWRATAYNYAKTIYSGLGKDHIWEMIRGNAGVTGTDVVTDAVVGGTTTAQPTWSGGVISLDTGAIANNSVGLNPLNATPIIASAKNGAPWMYIARALFKPSANLTGNAFMLCGLTAASGPGASAVSVGIAAPTSTTNFVLRTNAGGATTSVDTGVAINTTTFVDIGIGFDGTNIQAYLGQLLSGTFAPIGLPITDLTNLNTVGVVPWSTSVTGSATSWTLNVDTWWVAHAAATA